MQPVMPLKSMMNSYLVRQTQPTRRYADSQNPTLLERGRLEDSYR